MQPHRIESKSSQTAAYTCFTRGCATREKNPHFRGPDYIAEKLFPPLARLVLNIKPARKLMIKTMFPPGIYEYVLARTKVMDEAFQLALQEQYKQVVILGAGFDSRAIRFNNVNQSTRIIELDAATTQNAKIEVMQKNNIQIPSTLTFAPIDFNKEDVLEVLRKNRYTENERTLFLWEGVTMYISACAVDSTLEFIREYSDAGSRVVFDYIYASVLRKENRYYGEKGIVNTVSSVGEGWSFGLEEGEIERFLDKRGFNCVTHYSPEDLESQFLTDDDGTLLGRVNGTHCIVVAEVKEE